MSDPVQLGQHPPAGHVLAHLSDPHLLAAGQLQYGVVDSEAGLVAALERLGRVDPPPQVLVFTGDLADKHLAVLRERHDRRCRPGTLGVGDHDGVATLEDGYHRVGGSEVYSYGFAHGVVSFFPVC